ncbi:hypothetical protein H2203_006963 [Taxawa tesnikishii (nom. ined.)]|nr:hypothetical protein H2203_006963 [Dothideales sp. JES 119]
MHLTIQGVREWYNKLADMGVKFHYVSNSPYQLYPVLTSFFSHAGLPKGTFHLKQYTGMFQGIFEPVAERKKSTLDKLMRDFPERKWILVGDSGEADLEVYTDVVMEYPNRILGIFIRDVTTPPDKGFFDSAMGPLSGERSPKFHKRNQSTDSLSGAKRFSRPDDIQDDDEELRKAIAESLKEMEEQAAKDRRSVFSDTPATTRFQDPDRKEARPMLPPRQTTEPAAPRSQAMESLGDLIDFSDDEASPSLGVQQAKPSRTGRPAPPAQLHKAASFAEPHTATPPRRPVKPMNLRSPSNEGATAHAPAPAPNATIPRPQPPKPRKPSTTVNPITPSPLSQVQANSPLATQRPALPERPTTYRAAAKQKLATAYNALPSASAYWHGAPSTQPTGPPRPTFASEDAGFAPSPRSVSTVNTRSTDELYPRGGQAVAGSSSRREAPPAPPPRRNLSAYPAAAASYATNRLSGGNWDGSSGGNGNNVNAGNVGQPINKREEAWKRRWARSKEIMEHRGVLLRTWRVGEDVMEQCTQLVEKALREMEAETGKQADRGQAEPNGVADRGRRSR